MRRSIHVWPIAILFSGAGISWSQTQTVPSVYNDLYSQLTGDETTFLATIKGVWNGSISSSTIYAGQLTSANSNNGPGLVSPSQLSVYQNEILLWKAVGAKAISVEVSFPMLYGAFLTPLTPSGQADYEVQFSNLYATIAAMVRAQGLGLIVEIQTMDTETAGAHTGAPNAINNALPAFYQPGGSPLPFATYLSDRAADAVTIVQTMQPDYVILQEEPDVEASNSGQPVQLVQYSTEILNSTYAAVAAARAAAPSGSYLANMKIGAGFGSWIAYAGTLWANSFTQSNCTMPIGTTGAQPCVTTKMDFLDMHLFPIIQDASNCKTAPGPGTCPTPDFQSNTMQILATATAAGMHMTISQCWLRKVRDAEWSLLSLPATPSGTQFGGDIEEAREAYSFWEPLDQSFLQIVYDLANYQGMYWVAPFNTQSLSAYLTWDNGTNAIYDDCDTWTYSAGFTGSPCGTLDDTAVFSSVVASGGTQLVAAQYASTAQFWHNLIAPADTTPPTTPTSLQAAACASSVDLSWNPSTDDVGVAGYQVWRNGVQIASVIAASYSDTGLAASTAYTYQVKAFDLSSNISQPATVSITTPVASQISVCAVTNAASFTANSLSPGAIATIFGTNLATSSAPAGSTPLPTMLGGATVTVNGIKAPLFYASPLQINFQIPNEVQAGTASVVVAVGSVSSPPLSISVQTAAPGIFTFPLNRAALRNPDESINNSNNPVAAGGAIVAYLTGLGPVNNPVPDGVATPDSPLSRATSSYSATIGNQNANVFFLGLAPGYVGLAQANITVPSSLPSGSYPLVITVNGVQSNGPLVTVSALAAQ
ncbi:MAG: hypothetical protein ABSH32_23650 [Bryobacteraceae bacterium]|jgi:uncharacterized protein (TIGR03437 family)